MESPVAKSVLMSGNSFEDQLFPLFEDAGVGFGKIGLDCAWLRVNHKLCELTGYSEQELLGLTFIDITHPDDIQADLDNMQAVIAGELPINVMEKRYIHKNGSTIWIHLTATLARDEKGSPDYFIVVIEDITARKEAEEELKTYARRIEQSNKELEQFATAVSHDLQTPLRKVILFGDALKASADGLSDEQKDYIDRMQRACHRMQNVITDLLNLSSIKRKGQPFRKTRLKDIIEEARADLLYDIRAVNGKIELGDVDFQLEIDGGQIQQLLRHLIENSMKFHRKGVEPVVRIHAKLLTDDICEITVQDNGIGFDEKHAGRIFGIFERLVGASEYEGTGIGLAICHKIAERHGGTVTALSKIGEGSTFIVLLPQQQKEP